MPNGIKRVFCCLKRKNTEPKQGYRRCKLGSSLTKNVLAYYRSHGLESLMEGHNWLLNQFVKTNHCRLLISFGKRWLKPYTVGDQLLMTTGPDSLKRVSEGRLLLVHPGSYFLLRIEYYTTLNCSFFIRMHRLILLSTLVSASEAFLIWQEKKYRSSSLHANDPSGGFR